MATSLRSEITREVFQAWRRVLAGDWPNVSIEITRECPLHLAGCYVYGRARLGGDVTCRELFQS